VKALSGKAFCRLLERHGWQQLRIQSSRVRQDGPARPDLGAGPGNRPLKLGLQRHLLELAGIAEDEAR
jgi:hypothetical protein